MDRVDLRGEPRDLGPQVRSECDPPAHALVERALAGDHDAFAELAGGVVDRLFAAAQTVLDDQVQAENATRNTLVTAWRDLSALRAPDLFEPWLRHLMLRACAREARDARPLALGRIDGLTIHDVNEAVASRLQQVAAIDVPGADRRRHA